MIFEPLSWAPYTLYWLYDSVLIVFLSEAPLAELVVRVLSTYWQRVPSSRCRSFRCLAKVSSKMVGKFQTFGTRLSSKIVVCVTCLGPATQKQMFLVILRLMNTEEGMF